MAASGKTVHIYTPRLIDVRGNFFTYRFASYTVEEHPSAFVHTLRNSLDAEVFHAAHPHAGYGYARSGIVSIRLDENGAQSPTSAFASFC